LSQRCWRVVWDAVECPLAKHVPIQPLWLGKFDHEMKAGARLALVEFKEGKLLQGPPENLKLPRSKLIALAKNAESALVAEKPDLLPYQTFSTAFCSNHDATRVSGSSLTLQLKAPANATATRCTWRVPGKPLPRSR
jgi:hypothetical protein